ARGARGRDAGRRRDRRAGRSDRVHRGDRLDRIAAHGRALTRFLVDRLREVPRLTLLPGVAWDEDPVGYGIVAFRVDGARSDDLGFALSSGGFYVRTGRHCLPAASSYDDSV